MAKLTKVLHLSEWKPRARERVLLFAMVSGPFSIVAFILTIMVLASVLHRLPKPVDTYQAITDVTRVQNYARNSLLLWMAGNSSSQKTLLRRSSAAKSIELSEVPFEVRSIDPSDIERWQGANAAQWRVTFAVTFVAPGSGTSQINRYAVTVLDRDHDYQLLLWPSIVNVDTTPFKVSTKYTMSVADEGLADSLERFVTAYLTSKGGATSLGQYVSARFHGSAITDSPYTEATVLDIWSAQGDPQLTAKTEPGTELHVLVRVKASASIKTWSIMDLALKVSMGSNKVWLVDGIDAPIHWGDIDPDPDKISGGSLGGTSGKSTEPGK